MFALLCFTQFLLHVVWHHLEFYAMRRCQGLW